MCKTIFLDFNQKKIVFHQTRNQTAFPKTSFETLDWQVFPAKVNH